MFIVASIRLSTSVMGTVARIAWCIRCVRLVLTSRVIAIFILTDRLTNRPMTRPASESAVFMVVSVSLPPREKWFIIIRLVVPNSSRSKFANITGTVHWTTPFSSGFLATPTLPPTGRYSEKVVLKVAADHYCSRLQLHPPTVIVVWVPLMTPLVDRLHSPSSLPVGLDRLKALLMFMCSIRMGPLSLYIVLVMVSFRLLTTPRLLVAITVLALVVDVSIRLALNGPTAVTPTIPVETFLVVRVLVVVSVLRITRFAVTIAILAFL